MPANGLPVRKVWLGSRIYKTGVDRVGIADRGGDQLVFLGKGDHVIELLGGGQAAGRKLGDGEPRQNILRNNLVFQEQAAVFFGLALISAWPG